MDCAFAEARAPNLEWVSVRVTHDDCVNESSPHAGTSHLPQHTCTCSTCRRGGSSGYAAAAGDGVGEEQWISRIRTPCCRFCSCKLTKVTHEIHKLSLSRTETHSRFGLALRQTHNRTPQGSHKPLPKRHLRTQQRISKMGKGKGVWPLPRHPRLRIARRSQYPGRAASREPPSASCAARALAPPVQAAGAHTALCLSRAPADAWPIPHRSSRLPAAVLRPARRVASRYTNTDHRSLGVPEC